MVGEFFESIREAPQILQDTARTCLGTGLLALSVAIAATLLLPGWFRLFALIPGIPALILVILGGYLWWGLRD